MNLVEFIKANADKLAEIPNAADFADKLATAAKAAGFDLLANNVTDPQAPTYIPKSRLDEVVAARNTLKGQVGDYEKQLAELGKQLKDNEPALAKLKEIQETNGKLQQDMKNQALDFAVKTALGQAKAKHPDLLLGKIDRAKLELGEDGTLKGMGDQLKAMQEQYKDLFEPAVPPAGGPSSPPPPGATNFATADRAAAAAEAAKYGIRL